MAPVHDSPHASYHALPQSPDREAEVELDDSHILLRPPPVDPSSALVDTRIWWIHFILGCSVLLPWNVVITAIPFFNSRLVGSPIQPAFSSYLSTSFTAANFIFLGHATAKSKHTIPSRQTRITILCLAALTFLLTLSTFFVISPGMFATFILLNGAAQATAGAYLQTSLIAVASLFGPRAVQAMMSGQAAVAVAVSGVQVLSAATSIWQNPGLYESDGSAEERSAFIFFSMSTVFLLASAGAHSWLTSMPIYTTVVGALEQGAKDSRHEETHRSVPNRRDDASYDIANALRVAKANITYEIAVAYVFLITLAVYPPITSSVQPTDPRIHPLLFSAVHFLMFNIGDFFGRSLCSFPRLLVWSSKRLLILSGVRTLFVPVFLMCNVQRPTTAAVSNHPIIDSDILFMFILFLFGCSNGYVSSLCMMSAPSIEHNPKLRGRVEDVDVAATVASFCLVGGLAIGSICSFAVSAAICGCNPFIQ